MNERTLPKAKLLAVAVAAALGGAPFGAYAVPTVTLTALENLGSNSSSGAADIMTNPPLNGGDFFASPIDASNNSLFYHTYGILNSPSGPAYFGARVSGQGTFYGQTSVAYQDSYTNLSGSAQLVTFLFNVDYGQVGLYGTGSGFADLLLELKFNGTVVDSSHTRVDTATNPECSTGGQGTLAGYMSCNGSDASGNNGSYSASYLLGNQATLTIDYDIVSTVAGMFDGNTAAYGDCFGYGNVQLTLAAEVGGPTSPAPGCSTPFNAVARSGDPPGLFYDTAGFSLTAQSVPEPGSLALTGLALGGLAAARRRKRGKPG